MLKCDFNKVAASVAIDALRIVTGKNHRQIKLEEIALRHGCSPVNLLHIFRTPFPRNISGRLFLKLKEGRIVWRG